MAFRASKREWSELYTLFRLLADGFIDMGTTGSESGKDGAYPVLAVQRDEHDGKRIYYVKDEIICIKDELESKNIPRPLFDEAAGLILNAMKSTSDDEVESPEGIEEFLDKLNIFDLEAKSKDRTDMRLLFTDGLLLSAGVIVRSRLSRMNPLLDGGRAANLKYELTGMKLANPVINKVNALDGTNAVVERMLLIESLGGILKYSDVADRVFRGNLAMIDLHFPRLLAEMLRVMYLDGLTRINEITSVIKKINPLKIKDDFINKHLFYEHKIKEFLVASATGMRPAKIYTGFTDINGLILVTGEGKLLYYPAAEKNLFAEFLFNNTRFEKGDTQKDNYGFLEKENGIHYFRLNTKIGLVKR